MIYDDWIASGGYILQKSLSGRGLWGYWAFEKFWILIDKCNGNNKKQKV